MRLQRNRVVAEQNDRLAEVPTESGGLELVGKTVLYAQQREMRKFNVLLPTPQTEADWEEMPWLMGQGVGLVDDIRPAGEVVERMMSEAQTILERLARTDGFRRLARRTGNALPLPPTGALDASGQT